MKKSDIINYLMETQDFSKRQAKEVVAALFDVRLNLGIIPKTLLKGEKVNISGFGTFALRKINPRIIKMPTSDVKEIQVPCRKYACFKPGKALRAAIRKAMN
jgi:nucleoid DNA-binding protein